MIEEFFKELESKAKSNGLDYEKIVNKYREWYDLGKEAGLTDEEILNKFGNVDSILSIDDDEDYDEDYREDDDFEVNDNEYLDDQVEFDNNKSEKTNFKSFSIDIFNSGDVSIDFVEGNEITYKIDSNLHEYYNVVNNGNIFSISGSGFVKKTFRRKLDGDIRIKIGKDIMFDNFTIKNVSCDINIKGNRINADNIFIKNVSGDINFQNIVLLTKHVKIRNVSGDVDFNSIVCDGEFSIATVSGDINFENLKFNIGEISSTSGDIDIANIDCNFIKANTISGDISAKGKVKNYKCNVISGNFYLNNEKICKDFKDVIKGFLRKNKE